MPDTAQALLVTVVAVLPGLLYVLAFERVVGSWGVNLADRVLRFVAVSAVFQVLYAPGALILYRHRHLDVPPAWAWSSASVYVAVPLLAGVVVGHGYRRDAGWARALAGQGAAPRAWDWLWMRRPRGVVRLRLKSGRWIAGRFGIRSDGQRSYSGGFPEEGDIYLAQAIAVDPSSGAIQLAADGRPVEVQGSILVRWSEVEYLHLVEEVDQ